MLFNITHASIVTKNIISALNDNKGLYLEVDDVFPNAIHLRRSDGEEIAVYDRYSIEWDNFIRYDYPSLSKMKLFTNDIGDIITGDFIYDMGKKFYIDDDIVNSIYDQENEFDAVKYLSAKEHEYLNGVIKDLDDQNIVIEDIKTIAFKDKDDEDLHSVKIKCWIKDPVNDKRIYPIELSGRLDELCISDTPFNKRNWMLEWSGRIDYSIYDYNSLLKLADYIDKKIKDTKKSLKDKVMGAAGDKLIRSARSIRDDKDVESTKNYIDTKYHLYKERDEATSASSYIIKMPTKYIRKTHGTIYDVEGNEEVAEPITITNETSLVDIAKSEKASKPLRIVDGGSMTCYEIKLPNQKGEFGYPIEVIKIAKGDISPLFSSYDMSCEVDLNNCPKHLVLERISFDSLGMKKVETSIITKAELLYRLDRNNELIRRHEMSFTPSMTLERGKAIVSGVKEKAKSFAGSYKSLSNTKELDYDIEVSKAKNNDGEEIAVYTKVEKEKGREL